VKLAVALLSGGSGATLLLQKISLISVQVINRPLFSLQKLQVFHISELVLTLSHGSDMILYMHG